MHAFIIHLELKQISCNLLRSGSELMQTSFRIHLTLVHTLMRTHLELSEPIRKSGTRPHSFIFHSTLHRSSFRTHAELVCNMFRNHSKSSQKSFSISFIICFTIQYVNTTPTQNSLRTPYLVQGIPTGQIGVARTHELVLLELARKWLPLEHPPNRTNMFW